MYIVYKTTDNKTGKIYIGVHKQDDLEDDGYRGSNKHIKNIKNIDPKRLKREVLFSYDTEKEAYKKEKEIVNDDFISRNDTFNITSGGFGSFSHIDNFGDNNPMKVPENVKKCMEGRVYDNQREFMLSDKNPMYNEDILNKHFRGKKRPEHSRYMKEEFNRSNEWKEKISVSNSKCCIIDDMKFTSHKEAAQYFNVSISTITRWFKDGFPKRGVSGSGCIIDGVGYTSHKEASLSLGVSCSTLTYWKKRGLHGYKRKN